MAAQDCFTTPLQRRQYKLNCHALRLCDDSNNSVKRCPPGGTRSVKAVRLYLDSPRLTPLDTTQAAALTPLGMTAGGHMTTGG